MRSHLYDMKHTESDETFHYLVAQCLAWQDSISLSQWETFTYTRDFNYISDIFTDISAVYTTLGTDSFDIFRKLLI